MNFSSLTSTTGRTPARNIVTIPSRPKSLARHNIRKNRALAWHLMVNEAKVKHVQTVVK